MLGVYTIRSAGVNDQETDNVVLQRQGDAPQQKGRLRLTNGEIVWQGTRAELEGLFGGAFQIRDSFLLEVKLTPVAKSKSAGG